MGSGKVIDINRKYHYNKTGASLVQMTAAEDVCGYGNNQTFYVKHVEDSKSCLIQCKNSCLYWEIANASKANNAKIIQNTLNGAAHQQFEFIHCEKEKYFIKSIHSGKYVSIRDGSKADGAKVIQSDKKQQFICKT